MKDMLNNEATILPEVNEEEIWVDMTDMGYPRYQISSFGRLKGPRGEVLHPNTDKNGYLYCCVYVYENKMSKRKWVKIHRLVCEAFHGKPTEERPLTDHIDRCRINNYYKNLRWANGSENRKNAKKREIHSVQGKLSQIQLYSRNDKPLFVFENAQEASEMLGVSEQQIKSNLIGQRAPFRFGYFRYVNSKEKI